MNIIADYLLLSHLSEVSTNVCKKLILSKIIHIKLNYPFARLLSCSFSLYWRFNRQDLLCAVEQAKIGICAMRVIIFKVKVDSVNCFNQQ